MATDAHGTWINFAPTAPMAGVTIDSRKIKRGMLFFAIQTEKDDGHRYLSSALDNGACGAMVEHYNENVQIPQMVVHNSIAALQSIAAARRKRYTNSVIAIAGSYAKTTTKELLALLLGRSETLASAGNENNTIGVPLTLLKLDRDRHRYAVIEAGISRSGEMTAITEILLPSHVIFTAISQKHLEFFPSREALLEEKLRICEPVLKQNGLIVTEKSLAQLPQFTPFSKHLYAISRGQVRRDDAISYATHWQNGKMFCRITFPDSEIAEEDYELPIPSAGFAYDFALCRALTKRFNIAQEETAIRLAMWKSIPLRGQIFRHRMKKQTYFVDCYNSDVPTLVESIGIFKRKFPYVPHYYIIGSLGEYGIESECQHRLAGEQIPIGPHAHVFFLGEECIFTCDALKRRGFPSENLHMCMNLDEIRTAIREVEGAVYLKGSRIHQLEQLLDPDACELIN
ncbi:MAG: Mur ligase domain-containing protein [Puniceicoccales bacterium]|jgi:UDP-N-acetylmuramoyl-tripeptide--D-alanyl-D-alanine ligase|nr:Mur ligase domain-containing protein [Puniceicoccales bacterium]